jgi:hypothetical protein
LSVLVSGSNLGPETVLSFGDAGISTTDQTYSSSTGQITVTVSIATTVSAGSYDLTVAGPGGAASTLTGALTIG